MNCPDESAPAGKRFLILGASRGLGDALARGVPERGDFAWLVSRSRPSSLNVGDGVLRAWIRADLARPAAAQVIAKRLGKDPIDCLIYNAGIWESRGFQKGYDFERDDPREIQKILAVNLASPILCIQKLLPNLRRSPQPRIILIGSTSGLDNNGTREVTYSASKFGLRGVAHALREALRADRIPITCINPGYLANDVPYLAGEAEAIQKTKGTCIPLHDIVALVRCVLALSPMAYVKEINVPAITDPGI